MNYFSHARLQPEQTAALAHYVKDKVVYDLGAGLLGLAHEVVRLGARHVVAVDCIYKSRCENYLNDLQPWKSGSPKISLRAKTFEEFLRTNKRVIGTALVSWPRNYSGYGADGDTFLAILCALARKVIYIGTNFDGTSCGGPRLFQELRRREVLEHLPAKQSNLIVYGKTLRGAREELPEEAAQRSESVVWFEDVFPHLRTAAVPSSP